MPAIPNVPKAVGLMTPHTPTTLAGSGTDTFVYLPRTGQRLMFLNPTGGALTPVIIGSLAPTSFVAGPGVAPISLAAGFSMGAVSISYAQAKWIDLDDIFPYLVGACSITGGSGLLAWLSSES